MTLLDVSPLGEMRAIALRAAPQTGIFTTALPRTAIIRADDAMPPQPVTYGPMLCVCLQGRKQLALGDTIIRYGAGDSFVVSVDLPLTGQVIGATPEEPHIALAMGLDAAEATQLMIGRPAPPSESAPGLTAGSAEPELLDAVLRAMRLLERPEEIAILAPLIQREILFRVLNGPQGAMLRLLCARQGFAAQVSQAIGWIREHYREPLRVEALAKRVGMSVTSLHRHFKAVTRLSPLQYQKQLRLQTARSMLLVQAIDVGSAGNAVGYESTTQFTREYSRLFGAPPRRDTDRLRGVLSEAG